MEEPVWMFLETLVSAPRVPLLVNLRLAVVVVVALLSLEGRVRLRLQFPEGNPFGMRFLNGSGLEGA